jgi:hypothetical protein
MSRLLAAAAAAALLLAGCAELPPTPWPSPPDAAVNPRYVGANAETPNVSLMSADLLRRYRVAGLDMPDKYFAELNAAANGPQADQWLFCQNGPDTQEMTTVSKCARSLAGMKAAQAQRAETFRNLDHGVRKDFRLDADCTWGSNPPQTGAEMELFRRCVQQRGEEWERFANTPEFRDQVERCMQRSSVIGTDQRNAMYGTCMDEVRAQHEQQMQTDQPRQQAE